MDRAETDKPLPPFFEFSSAEAATMGLRRPWQRKLTPTFKHESADFVVYVLDGFEPGFVAQEPPELEEFGADGFFDSRGRQAELGIEDSTVVVKGWSRQPNVEVFDSLLRAAAASYLPQIDVGALSTAELRDRLVPVLREYQREQMLSWPAQKLARSIGRRIPLSGMAFWGAWVLAGMVGSVLPSLVFAFGWLGPITGLADVWIANLVSAVIIAFPQYVVLRLLIGHSSFAGAMWIPVSAVAWLAAALVDSVSTERITNALSSVGAIQALIPGPIPFMTLIIAVENITLAAVLGLAQGLLLARVFVARSATWLWFGGNLVAGVVNLIVIEARNNSAANQTNQTTLDLLLPIAIYGALYAAVTGIVLVALSRGDRKDAAPVVS